jgi:hypothetical protein
MGIDLDTTGLVHLFEGYGYLALGALLLAAAGAPLPWPHRRQLYRVRRAHGSSLWSKLPCARTRGDSGCYHRAQPPLLAGAEQQPEAAEVAAALRVEQGIAQNTSLLIFITRCLLTPLAGPVSLLAGAARVAVPRYLVWELAGTALYFCGYLALGRLLGPALLRDAHSLALFYGIIAVVVAQPSLLLWLRTGVLHRPNSAASADTAATKSNSGH